MPRTSTPPDQPRPRSTRGWRLWAARAGTALISAVLVLTAVGVVAVVVLLVAVLVQAAIAILSID